MKKWIIIVLFLVLTPFIVKAENCKEDEIKIESISIESKTENVREINPAVSEGKTIGLQISMIEVGDNIEYKLVIRNTSKNDFELTQEEFIDNSDYIAYSFRTEDESSIIKPNTSKIVYLKVEYKNEVPDNQLESGIFNDNKTMVIDLSSDNSNNIQNPNTGTKYIILIVIVLLVASAVFYGIAKDTKKSKLMIIMIGLLIPICVTALCKYQITIYSDIEIKKYSTFCLYGEEKELYIFNRGMTWEEYFESSLFNEDKMIILNKIRNNMVGFINNDEEYIAVPRYFNEYYNQSVPSGDIQTSENGCYLIRLG